MGDTTPKARCSRAVVWASVWATPPIPATPMGSTRIPTTTGVTIIEDAALLTRAGTTTGTATGTRIATGSTTAWPSAHGATTPSVLGVGSAAGAGTTGRGPPSSTCGMRIRALGAPTGPMTPGVGIGTGTTTGTTWAAAIAPTVHTAATTGGTTAALVRSTAAVAAQLMWSIAPPR